MKKKNWICLVLIAATLAVFFGYRAVARLAEDNSAPEISLEEQLLQVSVEDPESALLQGVTARDKRDGDVTASIVVESKKLKNSDGLLSVTYAAFDAAGNVAKAEREVQLTDYHSPRFTLSRSLDFVQGTSFDLLSIVGVEDVIDGDLQHRLRATVLDEVAVSNQGTHDVEFKVTNSLGDTVELVLPVEVYPSGTYLAELSLTDYIVYLNVGDAFRVEDYLSTYTYLREDVSLRNGLPTGYILRTTGDVDTGTPGVYTLGVKVSTSHSEQLCTGYAKLIVVVEG